MGNDVFIGRYSFTLSSLSQIGQSFPILELVHNSIIWIRLRGRLRCSNHILIAAAAKHNISLVVVLLSLLRTPHQLLVVIFITNQIGVVAVREPHQNHITIVVCAGSITLLRIDAVQLVKGLDDLRVVRIVICHSQIALQCSGKILNAVVINISSNEKTGSYHTVHGIHLLSGGRQILKIKGHVVGIIWRICRTWGHSRMCRRIVLSVLRRRIRSNLIIIKRLQ